MHNFTILETGEQINYASCIDELTPRQWIRLNELLLQVDAKKIINNDLFTDLAFELLNIPRRQVLKIKRKPASFRNSIYTNVFRIGESLHSFFRDEEHDGKKCLIPNLETTKNLLPKLPKFNLYGPSDALTDISFQEYDDANFFYRQYLQTRSEEDLNSLIATLYRPRRRLLWLKKILPNYNGNERIKYNKNVVPARAKKLSKLPVYIRLAVFYFYHSCEKFMTEGSININGHDVKLSVLYESDPDAPKTEGTIGLTGLLFELAESGVFGNAEETAKQNLFDIMARLYQIRVSAKAMREYYKSKQTSNT